MIIIISHSVWKHPISPYKSSISINVPWISPQYPIHMVNLWIPPIQLECLQSTIIILQFYRMLIHVISMGVILGVPHDEKNTPTYFQWISGCSTTNASLPGGSKALPPSSFLKSQERPSRAGGQALRRSWGSMCPSWDMAIPDFCESLNGKNIGNPVYMEVLMGRYVVIWHMGNPRSSHGASDDDWENMGNSSTKWWFCMTMFAGGSYSETRMWLNTLQTKL